MLKAYARSAANLLLTKDEPRRFAIIIPERGGLSGSKVLEWFKRKTSIAGYEIPNWIIVLGAIIIVLLIFQNLH